MATPDDRAPPDRASRVGALALVFALVLGGGCERDPRFELFSVGELSSERLDAGRTVSLRGSGFPVGREVEVVLDGVLHGPLGERSRVRHALVGRTVTPERVDVPVTDADVARLGGRGTFEGSLEVVVPGAPLDGRRARVVGTATGLVLDVVPSERRMRSRGAREGLPLGSLLGLELARGAADVDDEAELDADPEAAGEVTLDPVDDGAPGIEVLAVGPQSVAGRLGLLEAGLSAGARIVTLDGMRVLDADELRVRSSARTCVLGVLARGGAEVSIRVDVDAALGRRRTASYRYDQLAAVVLVAAGLFGAWPRGRSRPPRPRLPSEERPYASLVTGLGALVIVLCASALASPSALAFPVWLGAALFLRAAASLAVDGEPSSGVEATGPDPRLLAGLRRAWRGVLARESFVLPAGALAATIAIGVFPTAAGSPGTAAVPLLGGPLASAPWMPMAWPLVRSAFGPLALLALLAAAAASPRALSQPASRRGRLLRGLDDLGLAMMASVFVRVAVADPGSTDVVVRATGLVATALLYAGLVRARVAGSARGALARAGLALSLGALTTACVAAWLSAAPEPATEQAVAEVVLLALGLVIVRVASLGHRTEAAMEGGEPPGLRRQSAS